MRRMRSAFVACLLGAAGLAASPAWAQVQGGERAQPGSRTGEAASGARASVPDNARGVIERADRAWNGLDSVAFEMTGSADGIVPMIRERLPRMRGELWILPNADGRGLVRAAGTGTVEENPEASFDMVWGARESAWLDHEGQRLVRGPRATGFSGSIASAVMLAPLEGLRGKSPFSGLVDKAERVTLGPAVELDGQRCDVLVFMMPNSVTYRYAIAPDGLPRQVRLQMDALSQELLLSRPDTSRRLSASAFELRLPEGWTEARETAPSARAPRPGEPQRQRARLDPRGVDPIGEEIEGGGVQPQQEAVAPARPVPAPADLTMAPGFELKTPTGDVVKLEDLRGRVVVLDFWGTWCLPCKLSSPLVQKLHEDYEGKAVTVLGLAVRERDLSKPAQYMQENGYTYTILLEADAVAEAYRVRAYPSFVVIGPSGEVLHFARGFHPENNNPFARIREIIDEQLEKLGG